MKLTTIQKKAAEKAKKLGTYHIEDGVHEGILMSVEYNEENERVYLKFELNDGTIFKCSTDIADYAEEPLYNIIDPFVDDNGEIDFDEIKGVDVRIETETNDAADGKQFSNITSFSYTNYGDETDD